MQVNGMEVNWGKVLWCEGCDEIMNWDKDSGFWTCPLCEDSVRGRELRLQED